MKLYWCRKCKSWKPQTKFIVGPGGFDYDRGFCQKCREIKSASAVKRPSMGLAEALLNAPAVFEK